MCEVRPLQGPTYFQAVIRGWCPRIFNFTSSVCRDSIPERVGFKNQILSPPSRSGYCPVRKRCRIPQEARLTHLEKLAFDDVPSDQQYISSSRERLIL